VEETEELKPVSTMRIEPPCASMVSGAFSPFSRVDIDFPPVEPPARSPGGVFVYILTCPDGSFYVGSAKDVSRRTGLHQDGRGAKFTHDHSAVKLIYAEGPFSLEEAVRREFQIKGWSRAKKTALIRGEFERLRHLSRSHD
jgi:putative endonuclease